MRKSPRRPLILKRRKLPFQQNDPPVDEPDLPKRREPEPSHVPDCVRIMDHPTMSDTQVVVIPKSAHLQSVIGALTAKGKESGQQGPNKFILLSGSLEAGMEPSCQANLEGDALCNRNSMVVVPDTRTEETMAIDQCLLDTENTLTLIKSLTRDLDCSPLDDSLTNIQWLGKMSTEVEVLSPNPAELKQPKEENLNDDAQQQPLELDKVEPEVKNPAAERPPYSYMAMIQFAINSKRNRKMTLKEIYSWIEAHFLYFRDVAKPGWKNSIRHNLSLYDMFIRETSPDGKVSGKWTIRPEANRCLTLDQVYKPGGEASSSPSSQTMQVSDQHQQKRMGLDMKKQAGHTERKIKPLLPRTESYLVPIQLPITPSIYLSSGQLSLQTALQKPRSTGGGKRVRIAPKVTHCDPPVVPIKEEQVQMSLNAETPMTTQLLRRREVSSSRRKQRLVCPASEEPVLHFPDSTFFDSGLASDASAFLDTHDTDPPAEPDNPFREYSFKTPVKGDHPASSTPSKPLPSSAVPEPCRATPLGKENHGVLDFSPIRTPSWSSTPQRQDYTPFSFSGTPFKELPLFNSPRELLTSSNRSSCRLGGPAGADTSPQQFQSCSRELQVGGSAAADNRPLTEGLVLDTLNDSLTKILVDISFSALEDDDLTMGNISWSQLIPEFK